MDTLESAFKPLDQHAVVLYLEVPRTSVVLLQVFFELYDGVGAIRTVTAGDTGRAIATGLISILTTPEQVKTCCGLLNQIRDRVPWRLVECPEDAFIKQAKDYNYD